MKALWPTEASPLIAACDFGHLPCVQLLSTYGAPRTSEAFEAEEVATRAGHDDLVSWLILSRQWSTPLHHLTVIDAVRARKGLPRDALTLDKSAEAQKSNSRIKG